MEPYILVVVICAGLPLVLTVMLLLMANALCDLAIKSKHSDPSEEQFDQLLIKAGKGDCVPFLHQGRDFYNCRAKEAKHLYITSCDGLKLHALLFERPDARAIVVISHGYRSAARHDFAPVLEKYLNLGFHVLAIDQRGHGKSEGEQICFGVKERYDMRDWLKELQRHYPEMPVLISGISMGASVALMAAALPDVPSNLAGLSADCGFSHPRKEVCHVLKSKMHIPSFPLYHLADLICRKKAGFSFNDCDLTKDIRNVRVPVLFIHGLSDDFVPSYHTKRMYEAFEGKKEIVLVENAGHGVSYLEEPERVSAVLEKFFDDCLEEWATKNQKSG